MTANQLPCKFDVDQYNGLHSIEDADSTARVDNSLGDLLDRASKLFVQHGVHSRFGVALLHNHSKCEPGERMIQYQETVNGERALVTRPVRKEIDLRTEVPWVWALSGTEFVPLEFTTDRAARHRFFEGEVAPDFLNAFRHLVSDSRIGNLVGLAITDRAFFDSAKSDEAPIEFSNMSERSNVIFLRSRSTITNSIETAWAFEGYVDAETGLNATTSCAATCRWECIVDYGTHSRLHFDHHVQRPD